MAFATSQEFFDTICTRFQSAKALSDKALVVFALSGDLGGNYWARVDNGQCEVGSGDVPATITVPVDMTLSASGDDWVKLVNGDLNAMNAFMMGKIKVKGNMGLAMKLQQWFDF